MLVVILILGLFLDDSCGRQFSRRVLAYSGEVTAANEWNGAQQSRDEKNQGGGFRGSVGVLLRDEEGIGRRGEGG